MQSLGLSLEDIFLKLTAHDEAPAGGEAAAEPETAEPAAAPAGEESE